MNSALCDSTNGWFALQGNWWTMVMVDNVME